MQIHEDVKKGILSQKSDRLPPPNGVNQSSRCSHSKRHSIGSTIRLPISRPSREVGPEEAQNVDQKQIRVFRVFRLGG